MQSLPVAVIATILDEKSVLPGGAGEVVGVSAYREGQGLQGTLHLPWQHIRVCCQGLGMWPECVAKQETSACALRKRGVGLHWRSVLRVWAWALPLCVAVRNWRVCERQQLV